MGSVIILSFLFDETMFLEAMLCLFSPLFRLTVSSTHLRQLLDQRSCEDAGLFGRRPLAIAGGIAVLRRIHSSGGLAPL